MLVLAKQFRGLVRRFPHVKFTMLSRPCNFRGYAEYMGFFKYLGFERGNGPNAAKGSKSYIPIRIFDLEKIRQLAGDEPIGLLIDREASALAEVLSQSSEGPLFDTFQYALRETMRNAAEHSKGSELAVFGQYWPTKKKAEIVILDNGIGIAETLYDNEYIDCQNERDALRFALLPGISGVSREERAIQHERWGNSGFGLFVTSRICSENGLFRILSGNNGLTLKGGVQIEHSWSARGTYIQLILNIDDRTRMPARVKELVESAENRRLEIFQDYPIQASAASKMLASDFRKEAEEGWVFR